MKIASQERGAQRCDLERQLAATRSFADKFARRLEAKDSIPKIVPRHLVEIEVQDEELARQLAVPNEPDSVWLPANYKGIYFMALTELEDHLASD